MLFRSSDTTSGQFVVQPWNTAGNLIRIQLSSSATSTVSFNWQPGSIAFAASGATPANWTYRGSDIPVPGDENARMNLWLNSGKAPSDGKPVEVVFRSFSFNR